jgi:hypothetical protein
MAAQSRRAGCGCCGCFFAVFLVLIALVVVGGIFFYFNAAEKLNPASAHRVPSPAMTFSRQTYSSARQKLDRFFADPAERDATFSNSEVNALLADAPELRVLRRGTVAVLNQNSAEVDCSVAVDLPVLPRRYLNCTLEIRPAMRAEELQLDVSRIEIEGKPVGAAGMHQYLFVVGMIEKTLSGLNKFQGDRAVRDVRIENGNLVLSR